MAAVTAAVVGAVAAVGSAGYGAYSASQTPSGPGQNPTISRLPEDPLSKAERDYYARMGIANIDKTAPTFGSVLATGGPGGADMNAAKFPLSVPGMTPNEASAFGLVGSHGEAIPYTSPGALAGSAGAGGAGPGATLTPEQTLYMARERNRIAAQTGQKAGPWASKVLNTNNRLGNITDRLSDLQGVTDPTQHQLNRIGRLTTKVGNVSQRQSNQLGGSLGGGQ